MKNSILGKKTARFANDREKVKRVPFGLGYDPGTPGVVERCLRCSFGNVQVVESVVWTIPLPLTSAEALQTFGDNVNLFGGSGSQAGVASIDSTMSINGILSTDLFIRGLGVHVFADPLTFSTIGNAWAAPALASASPPSPDVYTTNDQDNGALGSLVNASDATTQNFGPAVFQHGGSAWRAAYHFINAYQFQWKTGQRELVLNEPASDISYFSSFAQAEAAGTSDVPVIEFVAAANALYRAKGSGSIFLPVNFRRVGSVGTNVTDTSSNVGLFHPTRDFDLAPATWGGLTWQGNSCRGQMYREIDGCFLERGIPISMIFSVQDAVHHALMLEALTIDNDPLGTNIKIDENLTCYTSAATLADPGTDAPEAGTNGTQMLEQTMDTTPALVQQQVNTCRENFKSGILKIAIKLKGWEMPGAWKKYCLENPTLSRIINNGQVVSVG